LPRWTQTKLAVPALIVLLAAAAGAYQIWGQHEARAELEATLASLPAGSHGHYRSTSYNAFTHSIRIYGLEITRDGHPLLSVEEITLHHLSGSGTLDDPFKTSAARLVDTRVWRGGRSLTAALVEAENVEILAPDVPPPAGIPSWLVAPDSGTLLAAGALTATDIADNEGATLTALSVADYDDGYIREASATGFADSHGNRIASATAHAIDLGGLDVVFDTGRYGPGAQHWSAPRPLIGHADITGLQSQDKGSSVTVEGLTLDGFAARPFNRAPNTAYVKTAAFLRDAATAISVGSAAIAGMQYRDQETHVSGKLNTLSLSGYAEGVLGQASLEGLAVSDADRMEASVGHFQINGLTAKPLLREETADSTEGFIAAARSGGVHAARLALAQVSVTPAKSRPITLDSVEQTTTGSGLISFKLKLRGLSIPAEPKLELVDYVARLGIDPLVLDLDEAGTYDAAGRTVTIAPMVLTARGLASLSLSAQLTNVPEDVPQKKLGLAAFGSMGIGPFTVRFTNDSLVQRIIALEARQSNKSPADVTDAAKLAASFAAAAAVPEQPDAGQQVAAFVADPHVLTITATPASPVPLSAFSGSTVDTAKAALNLHLTAE
jgi:hypothetical protein